MAKVVVIKFKKGCRTYYFSAGKLALEKGMGVIVETAKGLEYATVVEAEKEVDEKQLTSPLKPVVRVATQKDLDGMKRNEERRPQAIATCKEKIRAHNLDMKLLDCEFSFDGSKVVFYFTSEERVDFRELVKDLASSFHLRIELRQVGIRDEAKLLGGIAPCGRECCCAGCMPEFQKVSIKMAKNQGLSLNPGKISGLCGRLMCCLAYENEYYAEAYKKMPKHGSTVGTPEGNGSVVSVNMLKMQVRVKIEKDGALYYRDFALDELSVKKGGDADVEEQEDRVEGEQKPRHEQKPNSEQKQQGEQRHGQKPRHEQKQNGEQKPQEGGQKPHGEHRHGHKNHRHDKKNRDGEHKKSPELKN